MNPALSGSSTLEHFECSNAIEIRNRIMYDFYPGLPQIHLPGNVRYMCRYKPSYLWFEERGVKVRGVTGDGGQLQCLGLAGVCDPHRLKSGHTHIPVENQTWACMRRQSPSPGHPGEGIGWNVSCAVGVYNVFLFQGDVIQWLFYSVQYATVYNTECAHYTVAGFITPNLWIQATPLDSVC